MRVAPFVLLLACSGLPSPSGPSATGPGTSFKAGQPGASGVSGVSGENGANGAQGPAGKDAQSSGSRIKATYFVGADGSRQFKAMHDSVLDDDVFVTKAADGAFRWLPYQYKAQCAHFTDDQCTQRVCWKLYGECSTLGVWSEVGATVCAASPTHIVALGSKLADNIPLFYQSPTACSPTTGTGTAGQHYMAGPETPAASFVEAEIVTED